MDIDHICYCGESLLSPAWRHRIGHACFDRHEARARDLAFVMTSFCPVIRPTDHAPPGRSHPARSFRRKRGYAPIDGLIATFDWQEPGDRQDSNRAMQFWTRRL